MLHPVSQLGVTTLYRAHSARDRKAIRFKKESDSQTRSRETHHLAINPKIKLIHTGAQQQHNYYYI